MNKKRLLKLADLLDADAKNKKGIKFDLNQWARPASSEVQFTEDEGVPVDCGTAACAVGLACISGAFKRSGFYYRLCYCEGPSRLHVVPTFNGKEDMDAVDEFFDISCAESNHLFQAHSYPKTKQKGALGERAVAKRIRDFSAGKSAPALD